jgi:hypothetical protein
VEVQSLDIPGTTGLEEGIIVEISLIPYLLYNKSLYKTKLRGF